MVHMSMRRLCVRPRHGAHISAKSGMAYGRHGVRAKLCEKHVMVQISWCTCECVSENFHGAHVNVVEMVHLQSTQSRQ